jgi:hypothetical protein
MRLAVDPVLNEWESGHGAILAPLATCERGGGECL